MQKCCLVVLLLFIGKICIAQPDSILTRIVLVGDAGELNFGRAPVVDAVRDSIPMDEKTTVVYLGDNLYNYGLPDEVMPEYITLKSVLDSQINITNGGKATVIFIPGNHDWSNAARNGQEILRRQEDYIKGKHLPNVLFFPSDGCPGPVEYPIKTSNGEVVLILYDSQWFIRKDGQKPGIESDCPYKTDDEFYAELEYLLNKNSKKLVILASHHTLKSYGIHGGYFPLKQFLFPLTDINKKLMIPIPVLGIIYPIVRGVYGTPEDLRYPAYANLIAGVEKIASKYPNVIFAAGHEHTLQLIKDSSHYYIVSGAGSKSTRVSSKPKKTIFKAQSFGFASLLISNNKNVHIDFYTVSKDSVTHAYSNNLFNFSNIKIEAFDSSMIPEAVPILMRNDSVKVAINSSYQKISGLQKLIAGKNYRKEWGTPVHLKVFRIDKEKGGLQIKSLGGGKQTKSLKLEDSNGQEWVLRTVDKDPTGSAPELLKSYIPDRVMKDMVTAEHPYGALVVPLLADAAQVVHSEPDYYFVPDDPAFGLYRKVFANKVCLLEAYEPGTDESDTKSTAKVIDKLIEDSKNHVDQEAVLRARLLDMMIGDWDRHFAQWRFLAADTGVGKYYIPTPRDRDNAFFYSDGLFVKSLTIAALPYLQGFRKHYPNIKWFNWEERNFDRFFMNNLDGTTWKRIIAKFQADESDTVINEAVAQLPPEIYRQNVKKMSAKLKSRRDLISKAGMRYYRFLSKEVNVVGSNINEYFKVFNTNDSLEVKVFKRKRNNDSSSVMFDRVFDSKTTRFINLYGLNGDDIFEIDSTASSKIKLRIIGGKGRDTFNISGNVRNTIYDFKMDSNYIKRFSKTKSQISGDLNVNRYDITGFNYNKYRFPLNVGYNEEDKFILGLGYSLTTYSFRKEPYSTYQRILPMYSFDSRKYRINYNGELNEVIGKHDIVLNADLYNSVLTNYFGLGNETKKDQNKNYNFYRVHYNYFSGDLLLRKRFHDLAEIKFGGTWYQYWNHYGDNSGKILSQPLMTGLDSASIFSRKSYIGGKISIAVHNLNNDLLPTRGISWTNELTSLFGTNENSRKITKYTTDMILYSSFSDPTKFVTVLRFGYGHIFNKNYEFFQAFDLGADNYLRGFRKNRFAGRSLLYQSTEIRYELFKSNSYIVPGAVGILAFNDVGRVWVPDQTSHKWHDSYGGGFYYSPYNFAIVSATIAFSNEGNLFNFSIGSKFNITF
ncbi:MAG: metallophosphoesterase [Ginsengibacter sp.]